MKVFNNTNRFKKLILIVVFMILFSFCCPIKSNAANGWKDVSGNISDFIFWLERGILRTLNNIFCDERHVYEYEKTDDAEGNKLTIYISPETIIKGKFAILNANIFDNITDPKTDSSDPAKDEYYDTASSGETISDKATSKMVEGRIKLRDTISGWYYAIRNLAIVGLLSILVYVGIRMMLTSTSQDKAKYKTMLKDWLVSLCLLMVMHYIMVGVLNLSSMIVDAIGKEGHNSNSIARTMEIITAINESDGEQHEVYIGSDGKLLPEGDKPADATKPDYTIGDAYAYELVLFGIIGYTFIFAVKYLLRMMTIIFLILIAPVTSITYAIDKIGDGKAQAFNMWFQEFFYQVIIQPFHLLIYVVLIGSASELADTNVLYSIMCFAVMIPAEKFIKQMFGFKDKLGSPLGAFATGALMNKLMNKGGSSGSKNSDSSSDKVELPPNKEKVNLPGTDGSENNNPRTQLDNNNRGTEENENNAENEGNDENSNTYLNGNTNESSNSGNAGNTEDNNLDENTNTLPSENNNNESPENNENSQSTNNNNNQTEKIEDKKPGRWKRAGRAFNNGVSRHYLRKYGTTKIKGKNGIVARAAKRGLNKAYNGAKNVGRKTIKGATTLAGAAALGLAGAMFGQGKAGLAAGAALGNKVGGSITNATDKAWKGAEDLAGDIHNEFWDKSKENDKRKFKENKNNQLLAMQNYKDRHGVRATGKELDKELENMYNMDLHGVNKDQFNDTLSQYEDNLENGMSDKDAMNTAMSSALQAQKYSAKDFRDEKAMKQAYDGLYKQYAKNGITGAAADKRIREILDGGAKMKGVSEGANLSGVNKTVDIPIQRKLPEGLRESLGIHEKEMTPEREQSISKLTVRLQDQGFDQAQINELARSAADSKVNADGVVKNYENIVEAAIEYNKNSSYDADIEKLVRGQNAGGDPTRAQIDAERNERFVLRTTLGIKDEDVTAARQLEESTFKTKTDKQMAREYAKANKSAIKNGKDMTFAKKQLETTLKEKGNLSPDKAKEEADKIHNFATGIYNDPGKKKNTK